MSNRNNGNDKFNYIYDEVEKIVLHCLDKYCSGFCSALSKDNIFIDESTINDLLGGSGWEAKGKYVENSMVISFSVARSSDNKETYVSLKYTMFSGKLDEQLKAIERTF